MKVLGPLIAATLLLVPCEAWASDDPQQWTTLAATVRLSDHWRASEELVIRFGEMRDGLYEVESNTLIGYRITGKVTAWAGYTHDPQYDGGTFTIMEQRAREQITFDDFVRLLGGTVSGRVRLEERWRDGVTDSACRLRPYVRYSRPLRAGSRTSLVFSHESFVDLDTTSFQRVKGEERMRNLIGIATKLDRHTTAEFEYLNQHSFVRRGGDNDDHIASLVLSVTL